MAKNDKTLEDCQADLEKAHKALLKVQTETLPNALNVVREARVALSKKKRESRAASIEVRVKDRDAKSEAAPEAAKPARKTRTSKKKS